jgi:hypothetical protein
MKHLQIDQPQLLEMLIKASPLRRPKGPLTAPTQMLDQAAAHIPIHHAHCLARVTKGKMIGPAQQLHVDPLDQIRHRFMTLPSTDHLTKRLPLRMQCLGRGDDIQIRLQLRLPVKLLSQSSELGRQSDLLDMGTLPHVNRSPDCQLLRSGTHVQAAHSSSDSACPQQGPLAPSCFQDFLATMGLSDSRPRQTFPVIYSRSSSGSITEPQRVSQVPRCIFPCALLPTTPGCPAGALTRFFPADGRLHHLRQLGHTQSA